jgi:hypothetical protein
MTAKRHTVCLSVHNTNVLQVLQNVSNKRIVACTAVAMQRPRNRRINKGVMEPVSRQWIGKHVPAATNTHATIELLLETVFPTWSVQMGYKEYNWGES